MATVTKAATPDPGLKSRLAAEKNKQLKMRVAAAWTLAKTMLPNAPENEQYKFATNLLANSTQALKLALKQTAVNAHYTRLAGRVEAELKVDLNDLLENPSVLSKERAAVTSELKGDAKNANAKTADDRKECGPMPDKYPEPKRNEPDGMEGSHAADRPKEPAAAMKAAGTKTAHDKDCKGCPVCDKDKDKKAAVKVAHDKDCKGCDECEPKDKKKAAVPVKKADAEADKKEKDKKDDKKEAAAPKKAAPKKAEAEKKADDAKDKKEASTPVTIALAAAKAAIAAAKVAVAKAAASKKAALAKKAEGDDDKPADDAPPDDKGDDDAPAEDAPEGDAPVDDGVSEEGDAPAGDEPPMDDAPADDEAEPFDEEHADLTDAVEDIKADIETLEEAIADFSGSPDDLALPAREGEMPMEEEGLEGEMPVDGMEGLDPLAPEGSEEELNLEDIFNQDAMADKVSSLNDEEEMMQAGLLGDDFFGPSEPSDLEAILEQEEGLTSPADMFALNGVDNDPLAAMFASVKEASSDSDIVAPGDLQAYFDTDLKSDVRDADNDHTGDIASDVLESLKQPTRVETRDTAAKLQPPPKGATVIRQIKQAAPAAKVAAGHGNLAKLLFTDDPDTF